MTTSVESNYLDSLTEQEMMEAAHNLGDDKTIILIAHRIITDNACEVTFCLDQEKIEALGSYSELVVSSQAYRELASTTA